MRRERASVVKEDPGTYKQKHSSVHSEHKSAHEHQSFKRSAGRLHGPKKGGRAVIGK